MALIRVHADPDTRSVMSGSDLLFSQIHQSSANALSAKLGKYVEVLNFRNSSL